jgi:hypothetical protein
MASNHHLRFWDSRGSRLKNRNAGTNRRSRAIRFFHLYKDVICYLLLLKITVYKEAITSLKPQTRYSTRYKLVDGHMNTADVVLGPDALYG